MQTIMLYCRSLETTVVNLLHCATLWSVGDGHALRLRRLRCLLIRHKIKAPLSQKQRVIPEVVAFLHHHGQELLRIAARSWSSPRGKFGTVRIEFGSRLPLRHSYLPA